MRTLSWHWVIFCRWGLKKSRTQDMRPLKCTVISARPSCPFSVPKHWVWETELWICTDVTFRIRGLCLMRQLRLALMRYTECMILKASFAFWDARLQYFKSIFCSFGHIWLKICPLVQINLLDPVKWQVGDTIVIASTGLRHSQSENEVRKISAISNGQSLFSCRCVFRVEIIL